MKEQTKNIKELIKNTIILFLGKASTQLISFLLLPLYTSYIITSEYGYVDLVTTYVSLLVIIITLQLDLASFRFLIDYRKDEQGRKKIISNVFISIILINIFFIVVFCIVNYFFAFKYGWLILLIIIANVFSSVLLQIARGLGKNIDYSIACIVGGVVTVLLNVILIMVFGLGGKGLLITMCASNVVISLYLIFKLKIYKMINFKLSDKKTIKELIKYSIPLIPNQISWWVIDASDRTIVSAVLGVASNGIYSIANKIPTILNGVYSVFHLSWSEQASIHYDEEGRDEYFGTVINNGIKLFGTLCLIIIAVLPFIFNILINENYAEAYYQIPILLIGILFNIIMSLCSVVYVAKKLSKELAKTSTITAFINVLVNLILINYIGIYAASVSTMVAYMFVMFYRWIDIKKYVNIKIDKKNFIIITLCLTIIIYTYYLRNYNISIVSLFIILIAAIYINRNLFKIINRKVKTLKENRNGKNM